MRGGPELWINPKVDDASRADRRCVDYSVHLDGIPTSLAADAKGNLYVTGRNADVFVTSIDPEGRILYRLNLGVNRGAIVSGIAADASGNAYIAGHGSFPVRNALQPEP